MRSSNTPALLVAAVLLALGLAARAQTTVYRCGSSYSQSPCEGGAALTVRDQPSADERAAAQATARHDAASARRLQAEREGDEARQRAEAQAQRQQRARQAAEQRERAQLSEPHPRVPPVSRKRGKAASPYFTASDGSGPAATKKKSSAPKAD